MNDDLITTSKKDYEYLLRCRKIVNLLKVAIKEV